MKHVVYSKHPAKIGFTKNCQPLKLCIMFVRNASGKSDTEQT